MQVEVTRKVETLGQFLGAIDAGRAAASQAIASVHAAAQSIRNSEATQMIATVDTIRARSQASAAVQRQRSSAQITALKPEIDRIDSAVDEIQTTLTQISARAIEVEGRANDAAQRAFDSVDSWLEEREAQLAQLGSECEQFISIVDELGATLDGQLEDFRSALDTALDDTDRVIDDVSEKVDVALIAPIEEAREEINAFLEALTGRIAEEMTPEIIDASVQDVTAGLRQSLATLVEALCDALDQLAQKVMASIDEGGGSRASLQPAIDVLGSAIDAIMAELDRIRGLASSVGISI